MNTPPKVWQLSQAKISGCSQANSMTARDSGSLPGKMPAPLLIPLVAPGVGEVAVEVGLVVGQVERARDGVAVEVLDGALREDLIVGRRVLQAGAAP
jgi:hypothetical protein